MKIYTAANVTDDEIHELRRTLTAEADNQMTDDSDMCGLALRDGAGIAKFLRDEGRARVAEILNTRNGR